MNRLAEPRRPITRCLIVNADDFGQSDAINEGIVRTHERGIVTSASLMVRWPAAVAAAAWAAHHADFSVGLHLDFGEWVFRAGRWEPLYEVVDLTDAHAVAREVDAQLARFHDLMARPPTHIDSHQHVHMQSPVTQIVSARARELEVPLRRCTQRVQYCGRFYGQTADGQPLPDEINVPALVRLVETLPLGVTELGCHPGIGVASGTMYLGERDVETATLCDPAARAAVADHGVDLCSFADLRGIV